MPDPKDPQALFAGFRPRFQQFARERLYLTGVSPATLKQYFWTFTHYPAHVPDAPEFPTKSALQTWVVAGQQSGLACATLNSLIITMNAYTQWLVTEGYLPQRHRLAKVKGFVPRVRPLSEGEVRALVVYKPPSWRKARVALAALTILDTGLRQAELLGLTWRDVNEAALQLLVKGKGRKERMVPMSTALRKRLLVWRRVCTQHYGEEAGAPEGWVFPGEGTGLQWCSDSSRRSVGLLWKGVVGKKYGWHILRHTFATTYLQQGGDITRLSAILGHTAVTTTQRYVHLAGNDLALHTERVSPLQRFHQGRR